VGFVVYKVALRQVYLLGSHNKRQVLVPRDANGICGLQGGTETGFCLCV
jgi:hypothetical protein